MKKVFAAALAVCFALLSLPVQAQTAPSGRSIVYPLENQPSVDAVLQPARFTRVALGSLMLHSMGLGGVGSGAVANCTTAPGSGLYVTVAPTLSSSLCGLYQVTADDATEMPVGYTPNLAADSTLIVVQALQSATSAALGPLTAPGVGLSVYWLVEAQISTTDTASSTRPFLNASTGVVSHPVVATQRQDAIAYQLKQGTPASSSPTQPAADSGYVPIAYVLVANGTTQISSGMVSDGGATFQGFARKERVVALAASPSPSPQPGNAAIAGTMSVGDLNDSGLSASTNVCTDGSEKLTTSGCSNGTVTGITAGTGVSVGGSAPSPTVSLQVPVTQPNGGSGLTIPDRGNNAMLNGLACDNSTNDATAFAAAPAQLVIPAGRTCKLSVGWTSLRDGTTTGPGLLSSLDSAQVNPRAPTNIVILSAPTFSGSAPFDPITGFNGDTTHMALAFESLINNSSGCIPSCPTSTYAVSPNTEGIEGVCKSGANAGFQQASGGVRGAGRTMLPCVGIGVNSAAQGDNPAIYTTVFVSGSPPPGLTDWLGDPAGAGIATQVNAGNNGVYLHPGGDQNCNDQGWDAECVGVAYNLNRTNNTAALHESWEGVRVQGTQTVPINAVLMATAQTPIGIDFSAINNGGSGTTADLVLKANDCVNWDGTNVAPSGASGHFAAYTSVGTEKTCYNSGDSSLEDTIGGTVITQVSAGGLNIPIANGLSFSGSQNKIPSTGTGALAAFQFDSGGSGNVASFTASNSLRFQILGNGATVANGFDRATQFQIGTTNVTGCDFCDGTLGTAAANVMRFANDEVGSTSFTSIGAADDSTVSGVHNTAFGLKDQTTLDEAIDASGNLGVLGGVFAQSTSLSGANPEIYTNTTGPTTITSAATSGAAFAWNNNGSTTGNTAIWQRNGTTQLSLGNTGVLTNAKGPIQSAALANSSTQTSYIPPVYTNTGGIVAATYHGAQFTCVFSASQTCDLGANYWTGGAVFTAAPVGCAVDTAGGGPSHSPLGAYRQPPPRSTPAHPTRKPLTESVGARSQHKTWGVGRPRDREPDPHVGLPHHEAATVKVSIDPNQSKITIASNREVEYNFQPSRGWLDTDYCLRLKIVLRWTRGSLTMCALARAANS